MNQSARYPRYRAPTGDGEILCRPNWQAIPELIQANSCLPETESLEIAGSTLASLRAEARRSALAAALTYTRSYSDLDVELSDAAPVIATGHQPGLVHPGVWLKNFAAARVASQLGVAVSLIIDSDLCRSHALQVPTGTVESPRVDYIPFDKASQQVPYEERAIADRSVWDSFGERATQSIPLCSNPSKHSASDSSPAGKVSEKPARSLSSK